MEIVFLYWSLLFMLFASNAWISAMNGQLMLDGERRKRERERETGLASRKSQVKKNNLILHQEHAKGDGSEQ